MAVSVFHNLPILQNRHNLKNLTEKTGLSTVSVDSTKMLQNAPNWVSIFKKFSGGDTPGPPFPGEGRGGEIDRNDFSLFQALIWMDGQHCGMPT